MEILKIYKNLLLEAEITSCVKNFGYELFGHELGGTEKNTGLENTYVRYIDDFTDNQYGEEISPEFIKALKTLKSCMNQYPEVLIPEKTNVYRGITIPIQNFINKKQPISITNPNPYIYKANSKIQSWSTNFEAASKFGSHEIINEISQNLDLSDYNSPEARKILLQEMIAEDLRIAFVLEYQTNPQEFIFKSKYFRMLSNAQHEDELIRIDNKPIQTIAKFNNSPNALITKKSILLIEYINQAIKELTN